MTWAWSGERFCGYSFCSFRVNVSTILITLPLSAQGMAKEPPAPPLSTVNGHMGRIISESPRPATQAVFNIESYWCYQIPTPGVSLGVLSPQGRHSATYTEHMSMNKLYIGMQPAGPWKAPCEQTPMTGSKRSPPVSPPG